MYVSRIVCVRCRPTLIDKRGDSCKGSVEHVGLRVDQLVPDGLEMQPADVVAADMLAAVAGFVFGHEPRLRARRFDHQLLLAAALERDEPERGGVDAVPARGQEPVVLM